jgi:alpha-beta hydrolase superfamily lysophospholipase
MENEMKKLIKLAKWLSISILALVVIAVITVRVTRKVDVMIYQADNFKPYPEFTSKYNVEEKYVTVDENVKLHTALFKPEKGQVIATIFHCLSKGENLMNAQNLYQPFLTHGFQIFSFEYRDVGLSTGKSINSQTLRKDVLYLFDELQKDKSVKQTPIIIWGRSMGTAFATMTASERQDKINGLVLEGGFSSFPDIAKHYAEFIHLERFKWLIPLVMHNDFPAEERIALIRKPVVVIHSSEDQAVPFALGKKLYEAANKQTTFFWEIKGKHLEGIKLYENDYLQKFKNMLD